MERTRGIECPCLEIGRYWVHSFFFDELPDFGNTPRHAGHHHLRSHIAEVRKSVRNLLLHVQHRSHRLWQRLVSLAKFSEEPCEGAFDYFVIHRLYENAVALREM